MELELKKQKLMQELEAIEAEIKGKENLAQIGYEFGLHTLTEAQLKVEFEAIKDKYNIETKQAVRQKRKKQAEVVEGNYSFAAA